MAKPLITEYQRSRTELDEELEVLNEDVKSDEKSSDDEAGE